MNIVLCGFMGSGKTVVGKELAKITGRKFVDTDELVEQQTGISIKAIFATHGEDYFRDLEHQVCREISKKDNLVVSTGGGVMTFERNAVVLKENGKIVFLDASFDVIVERIGDNTNRPLFQDKEKAKILYDERIEKYKKYADLSINGDMSARKTASDIANLLK